MSRRGVMRVGLSVGLLVAALGSGVLAQEPSPEPPPWFGGRVEMPEHGFAVRLPDDWVVFDTSVDFWSQFEAASGFIDPVAWSASVGGLEDEFALMPSNGVRLYAAHATGVHSCGVVEYPNADVPLDFMATFVFEMYDEDPLARVEQPQSIDLPAGPAYLLRMSEQFYPDVDVWEPSSAYLLGKDETLLAAYCTTEGARPEDDWLSIVETIEFLPADG